VAVVGGFEEELTAEFERLGLLDKLAKMGVVMTEVSTPVEMGDSRGGIDIIPVTVDREESVTTDTIVSGTGGMLVGLAVKPIKVSTTATKVESMMLPTGCWCRAWWLQAIHKTRPWIAGRGNRRLYC
jgi:hypothetical protein